VVLSKREITNTVTLFDTFGWPYTAVYLSSQVLQIAGEGKECKFCPQSTKQRVTDLLIIIWGIIWGWYLARGHYKEFIVGAPLAWVGNLKCRNPIGKFVFSWWALVLGCRLWIIYVYYRFWYLVNDDLYLLTTRLPVHGLFFMVDCV